MEEDKKISIDVSVGNLEEIKELRRELEKIRDLREDLSDSSSEEDTDGLDDFEFPDPPSPRPDPVYPDRPRFDKWRFTSENGSGAELEIDKVVEDLENELFKA